MNISEVVVSSKSKEVTRFNYEYPTTLEEGISVDGAEKVFELYSKARKQVATNVARQKALGGGTGMRALMAALKGDPELMERLKKEFKIS